MTKPRISFDPFSIGTIEDDQEVEIYDPEDSEEELATVKPSIPQQQQSTTPSSKAADNNPAKPLTKAEKKAAKKQARDQKKQLKSDPNNKGHQKPGPPATQQQQQSKKKNVKADEGGENLALNPDFTFEADGGDVLSFSGSHAWDFTLAKAALRQSQALLNGLKKSTATEGVENGTDSNGAGGDEGLTSLDDKIEKKRREILEKRRMEKKKLKRSALGEEEEEVEKVVKKAKKKDESDDEGSDEEQEGDEEELAFAEADSDDEEEAGVSVEGSEVEEDDEEEGEEEDDEVEEEDEEEESEEEESDEDDGDENAEDEVSTARGKRPDNDDANELDDDDDDVDEAEDVVHNKRKAEFFAPTPTSSETPLLQSFTDMSLSRPILKAISDLGFVKPTPIQSKAVPLALQGLDICGAASTGSGKTGAFVIPILERLLHRPKHTPTTRVLILVPTRELGVQCHSVATKLAKYTDIQLCLAVGGLSTKIQEAELKKRPDVVIATPGRLIDHLRNSASFGLDTVEILIIDEADRILEDGFADELNEIIKSTPKSRQTMLFSATMTDNVDSLIKLSLNRPIRLFMNNNTVASKLVQEFIRVRAHKEESRPAILLALCTRTYTSEVIVFFRSKAAAHHMKILFGLMGLKAAELHGNLTQLQRLEALESFRDKKVNYLLATDLASRGLDISGIKTVINYDMPKAYAQYVHRVGRTARADKAGRAVSLIGEQDRQVLKMALKSSKDEIKNRVIPSAVIAKFARQLASCESSVAEIYAEEKMEKEMKQAEMQVARMENMMLHEDEIKSRPAKTWFQTGKEKEKAKELGREKHKKDFGINDSDLLETKAPKRGKYDGLSRHKKRAKMAREEDAAILASASASIRNAKKASRPERLNAVMDPSKKKKAPQQAGGGKKKRSTFGEEMGGGKKKESGGGGSGGLGVKGKSGVGKKKKVGGAKSFKSLAKHKRRK
ncbi:nucleolar DEAD-box protein required for synthesis of 60S ribosomal subunit [Chytridiales sp. JEL 0842]|nr:nucleolar DEAD-box protein required for synthesis of 60S ribosomal subunit [Chytridiales sp. JEL 0842]